MAVQRMFSNFLQNIFRKRISTMKHKHGRQSGSFPLQFLFLPFILIFPLLLQPCSQCVTPFSPSVLYAMQFCDGQGRFCMVQHNEHCHVMVLTTVQCTDQQTLHQEEATMHLSSRRHSSCFSGHPD